MTRKTSRFAASLAAVAAFSMMATPALANHNWGWGGYRHRDRVDAGDVITGILIIGAIAAVADAAGKNKRERRYEPPRRDRSRDYDRDYSREDSRDERPEWRGEDRAPATGAANRNLNGAIDRCVGEASRGGGRPEIDSVARDGEGWLVTGRTGNGAGFSCTVDGDGRLRDINVDS